MRSWWAGVAGQASTELGPDGWVNCRREDRERIQAR